MIYVDVEVQPHIFLTLAVHGRKWSASYPRHFPPQESDPCTHWKKGFMVSKPAWKLGKIYKFPSLTENRIVISVLHLIV
jgi:hypothetical protein